MATQLWFRKQDGYYRVYSKKPKFREQVIIHGLRYLNQWRPNHLFGFCVADFNRLFPHLRQAKIGKEPVAVTVTIKVGGK